MRRRRGVIRRTVEKSRVAWRLPCPSIHPWKGHAHRSHLGHPRLEVLDALRGSQLIVHAGDIGSREVLDGLTEIAPTLAVRGDNDTQPGARTIPERRVVDAGGITLGSAGQRRFRLPVSVARMNVRRGKVEVELVSLNV